MRKLSILLLFLIPFFSFFAQDILALRKELIENPETRIQTATKLKDIYADLSNDSLYALGSYMLNQGIKDDHMATIHFGKLTLASYYNYAGKTELSIKYLTDCINYYGKKGDFEKLADAQNQMGIAYIYNTQYNQAANWLIKSIKTAEKLGEDNESYMAQLNLSEVYLREGKLDLAESEILSFIEKTKKQKLRQGLKKGYDYLAKTYMQKGDMPMAIAYYKKALDLALVNKSKTGKANAYNNIAIAHFEQGELQLSLDNFKKALELRLELNEPVQISESYYNLGDWNFYQGFYDEALKYYLISLDVALKNKLTKEIADAYNIISECYKMKKDFQKALEYKEMYVEQMQIMHKKNQVREIDLQRAAYEIEREEQLLNQKKRENQIRHRIENEQDRGKFIVIGFSLVVGVLLIFYIFLLAKNSRKKALKTLENEEEPEIQPDFQMQASKWNRMEYFIEKNQLSVADSLEETSVFLKTIEGMDFLKFQENKFVCFEIGASTLEKYIFKNYLQQHLNAGTTDEQLIELFENQNLVDSKLVSYTIVVKTDIGFEVRGKNSLLLQVQGKIKFLTNVPVLVTDFSVFVSDRFKNELVSAKQWETFVEQLDLLQSTTHVMKVKALTQSWSVLLKEGKMGMGLLFN